MDASKIKNVMTVDVEDYFHVAALARSISVDDWDSISTRVENNTERLLDLFDKYNVKATFFVLGWVAERYPELVKKIDSKGHEVACHGYSHQLIYKQKPELFKEETFKAKMILEDIISKPVNGYRAASYSITKESMWALDVLEAVGFKYDSSIFPVRHDNYGIPGFPTKPHEMSLENGAKLVEFPLSTYKVFKQSIPVAGGGYFRLYPYWLTKYFYKSINKKNDPFVFYLHPWEIDPGQPRVKASWFSEFRHYNNLDICEARLEQLLRDFQFTTMQKSLEELEIV